MLGQQMRKYGVELHPWKVRNTENIDQPSSTLVKVYNLRSVNGEPFVGVDSDEEKARVSLLCLVIKKKGGGSCLVHTYVNQLSNIAFCRYHLHIFYNIIIHIEAICIYTIYIIYHILYHIVYNYIKSYSIIWCIFVEYNNIMMWY